jgi:hypothetical protein
MTKHILKNGGILTLNHPACTASYSPPETCLHIAVDYSEAMEELDRQNKQAAPPRATFDPLQVPVRFFIYDIEAEELDIIETNETTFLETTGEIEYERHTVFASGVSQICLTKRNI